MKNFYMRRFGNDNSLCLYLGCETFSLTIQSEEGVKTLDEHALPNLFLNEDVYLQALADALREDLGHLEGVEGLGVAFIIEQELLVIDEFSLPVLPKKEEQDAINWEINESVILDCQKHYYKVCKGMQREDQRIFYQVYGIAKDFMDKLLGMACGFGFKPWLIAPKIEYKNLMELAQCNLCPQELMDTEFTICLNKYSKLFCVASFVLALTVVFFLEGIMYYHKSELLDIEDELERNAMWQGNYRYAKFLESDTQRLEFLLYIVTKDSPKHSKILEAMGYGFVPGVRVRSIAAEGLGYKIHGTSKDMLGIKAWADEISICSEFKNVKIISTETKSDSFNYVANVSKR